MLQFAKKSSSGPDRAFIIDDAQSDGSLGCIMSVSCIINASNDLLFFRLV